MDVIVHKRIMERHPELTEQDVLDAWENAFTYASRTHCAHLLKRWRWGMTVNHD